MSSNPFKRVKKILKSSYPEFYFSIKDRYEVLSGKRDSLTPPERLIFVGDGDFKKVGNDFKKYFKEIGGLKPEDCVLDIGCGIGRMAVPLINYLDPEKGSYYGFDVVKYGIDWCNKNIARKYRNFHFSHADIYNKHYNIDGKIKSTEFRFPYENDTFDFVFLTSVFTHMLTEDVERYISEISRVIKIGGRCFVTSFLINQESLSCIEEGKSQFQFKNKLDKCYIENTEIPENVVGFDESFMLSMLEKYSLKKIGPIHYGYWCGRAEFLSLQDIIIVEK